MGSAGRVQAYALLGAASASGGENNWQSLTVLLNSFEGATRCNMSIVSSYFLSAEQIAVELDVESRNEDQWKGSPVQAPKSRDHLSTPVGPVLPVLAFVVTASTKDSLPLHSTPSLPPHYDCLPACCQFRSLTCFNIHSGGQIRN